MHEMRQLQLMLAKVRHASKQRLVTVQIKKPISAQSPSCDVTTATTRIVGENLGALNWNLLVELTFDDRLRRGLAVL